MKSFRARLLLSTALCFASQVEAATTPNSYITGQTPNRGVVQFLQNSDNAGTYKTLYAAGANGSKCIALTETNDDGSTTHLITVQIQNGSVKYGGVAVTTASNDGYANGVPPKNFFSSAIWPGLPLDNNGNPTLTMISGDTMVATFGTNLTTQTYINLQVQCTDY